LVKFLILRFSSIGDIVLTTPVIRGLKLQVEDAQIHYLTKKQYAGIVENNPYVDEVHVFDNNFKELVQELKHEHFDYIIDLHHNLRTARFKSALKVVDFTFNKLNIEKWLLVNLGINKLPNIHIVDRYLKTLSVFDVSNDLKGLEYYIPTADVVDLNTLPELFRNGYIAFAIGAQHSTKRLPESKITSLCKKLDFPIVLLGGKEDFATAEAIEKEVGAKVFNACGKFNLNQSASLVKQAIWIISHDTGLMHIAASFKKKIISVWGNTVPEFGMYPYLADEKSLIVEDKNLKCRPCTKIGFSRCPKKHFKCMNEINEELIVNHIKQNFG